jgi:hypothetical protein
MDGWMHGDTTLHFSTAHTATPRTQPHASLHFSSALTRRKAVSFVHTPFPRAPPLPGGALVPEAALVGRVLGLCGAPMIPPDWFYRFCRIIQLPTSTVCSLHVYP